MKTYIVKMNIREVVALRMILAKIGGCPNHTARGEADSVSEKLSKVFTVSDNFFGLTKKCFEDNTRAVYFSEASEHVIDELTGTVSAKRQLDKLKDELQLVQEQIASLDETRRNIERKIVNFTK